LINGKSIPS